MALSDFCDVLAGQGYREVDLAVALIWYHTEYEGIETVDSSEVGAELHSFRLTNKVNTTRLATNLGKDPRTVRVGKDGWRIHARKLRDLDAELRPWVDPTGKPENHNLIPLDMYERVPGELRHIADQAEASYEHWHFDSCAVMMRRLVESLLILAFSKTSNLSAITVDKDFLPLSGIIGKTNSGQFIRLSKGSNQRLDTIKDIGDRAAHHRSYKTAKPDIDDAGPKFRVLIDELLVICGC